MVAGSATSATTESRSTGYARVSSRLASLQPMGIQSRATTAMLSCLEAPPCLQALVSA